MTAAAMERAIEIRVRDNRSGHEDVITTSGRYTNSLPRLSADGSQLAWSDETEDKMAWAVGEPRSGSSKPVCENCTVLDFFPDGRETLVLQGNELLRRNAATSRQASLVDLTGLLFSDAALSPDGRWLAFTAARRDGTASLFLTTAGQQRAPRDAWIEIAEDRNYLSRPVWSTDGNWVYYGSTRDSFWCVWAQRIDGGKGDGPPVAARHFHRFLESSFLGGMYFAVTGENLYVLLAEMKGNTWMVKMDR